MENELRFFDKPPAPNEPIAFCPGDVLPKTRKGKNVSVAKTSGDCYQWKPKGQCTKGNACSFRHDENKRGQVTQSSSPAPKPQTRK